MNEWKTVRLGDVCEIQSGGTPSRSKTEYWKNGTIPWVKIGDFSGKYLNKTTEHITQKGLENSSAKLFSKGTILYSIFATLGEATILNIDASTNQAIAGIKIKDKSSIDIDYLFAYLNSLKEEVNRIGRGVAQNNINLSILKSFTVPLPPLETQKQIAKQLNKCTTLLEKHKQMLEKYDTLIKSRFIEMFGDPYSNPMGWERKTFKQVAIRLSDGPFGSNLKSEHYSTSGIRVIRLGNIGVNEFLDNDKAFIPFSHYETLRKYTCKAGEIVIGTMGVPNLRACIIPEEIEVSINKADCVHYIPKPELLDTRYVCQYINCPETLLLASGMIHGQTRTRVSSGQIAEMPISIPPLQLQKQFSSFVQQIDKSKFEMAIYEKLWYNYQIWRKKMGLFRGILDLFSTWTISDKFGLGAGFLYADYAWEKANERELNKMKAGVTQAITNYINENRKLLNDDLIQNLNTFINSIANCNKFNANSILSELKNFLMHKCAYHSCIIEILNHSIEAIESIPEDNLDDGVKIQALQKTKNVIDSSDSNQLPILLKDLFSFYDENGIEVENKEELFDKFESLRKEYLA